MRLRLFRHLMPSIVVTTLCAASLGGAAVLTGCANAGAARTGIVSGPGAVTDLVGMGAQSVDGEMIRRGYTNVGGYKTGGASITIWRNTSTGECARIETREGRVFATESRFEDDCTKGPRAAL
jgi:hypothetical protein